MPGHPIFIVVDYEYNALGTSAGNSLGGHVRQKIANVVVTFTDKVNGHHAVVRPPLSLERRGGLRDDVARITQNLAHELEFLIRRAPEQWHLFQPNWPSDPGY